MEEPKYYKVGTSLVSKEFTDKWMEFEKKVRKAGLIK